MKLFGNVPFATAARFEPPVPLGAWDGGHDPADCAPDPVQSRRGPLFGIDTARPMSEDCLRLNVWTPDPAGSRPVFAFVFGGGFEGGSAAPPLFPGARLARDLDAVVVGLNYRVGALGWLHLGGDRSNLGLQDLAAGLQWLQRNVSAFGGDPARVTVGGTSAGAFCIGALLGLPAAAGTFRAAYLSSGSTSRVYPAATAAAMREDFLREAGGLDAPVEEILAAQRAVIDTEIGRRNLPGGRAWGVVHDGVVVADLPHDRVVAGAARDVPLLVGACRDEINLFRMMQREAFDPPDLPTLQAEMGDVDAAAYGDGEPGAIRSAWLTETVYTGPAAALRDAQRAAGGRAWGYLFADAPLGPALGAFHSSDFLYLAGLLSAVGAETPERTAVRAELLAGVRSFVHDLDPGWEGTAVIGGA